MYYKEKDMKRIIILLYVDDLLLTIDDGKEIERMQKVFIENFEMINLGLTRLYFGVEFEYFPSRIWLHQSAYVRKILNKYAMNNCMLAKILMDHGVQL
jgi:hypothetical protein